MSHLVLSTTPSSDISTAPKTTSSEGEGTNKFSAESGIGDGIGTGTGDGEGDGDGNGSGEGEGIGTNPGVPVTPPTLQNYAELQYPSRAILDGITGMVQVKITVNAVTVTTGSGSGTLDQAAVDTVYQWTFSPALDTQGRPTACTIYVPVTFKMQ